MHFKSFEKCTSGRRVKRKTYIFVTDEYWIQMMKTDNEWVGIALVWIEDRSEDEWLYSRQWADNSPSDMWPKTHGSLESTRRHWPCFSSASSSFIGKRSWTFFSFPWAFRIVGKQHNYRPSSPFATWTGFLLGLSNCIMCPRYNVLALCEVIGHMLNGWYPGLIHMSKADEQEVTNGGFMQWPLTSALQTHDAHITCEQMHSFTNS